MSKEIIWDQLSKTIERNTRAIEDLAREFREFREQRLSVMTAQSEMSSEERADQLVQELMDQDSGAEQNDAPVATLKAPKYVGAQRPITRKKPVPPKTAPGAEARTVPQAKPAAPLPKANPEESADNTASRVPVKYLITLGVLGLALATVWVTGSRGNPTPDQLAQTALTDLETTRRVDAAAALTMIKQPDPTELLRQLAARSDDPAVLIQALNGLSVRGDSFSLPLFIGSLEHADALVRSAAWNGVLRFYGNQIPEGLDYQVDAPAEERTRVARRLKEIRDELLAKVPKDAKV